MSRLSPAATSFEPKEARPTQLAIRQAYVSDRGRRLDNPPYSSTHTHRREHAHQGHGGAYEAPSPRMNIAPQISTFSNSVQYSGDKSAPAGGEIIGHDKTDNKRAAIDIKASLTAEMKMQQPQTPISSAVTSPNISTSGEVGSSTSIIEAEANSILKYAFQQQYAADWRHRDISRMQDTNHEEDWKNQNKHLLPAILRTYPNSHTIDPTQYTPVPQFKRESSTPITSSVHEDVRSAKPYRTYTERLKLEGLDGNRSRNEYGRTLTATGGQQTGFGVIGNTSCPNTDHPATVVVNEVGCDIPMMTEPFYTQPQIQFVQDDYNDDKANIGGHIISLDPDLPPLAIEHPTSVWNSMIHSLQTDIQPVIQWKYEKVLPDTQTGESMWIAELTLILPPTHPTIAEHPLFSALPKNRWKQEYVSAVEALGGVKRWRGQGRELKADAQNTTLVKCISENALAWVLAPTGLESIPEDGNDDEQAEGDQVHLEYARFNARLHQTADSDCANYHPSPGLKGITPRPSAVQPNTRDASAQSENTEEINIEIDDDNEAVPITPITHTQSPIPSIRGSQNGFPTVLYHNLNPVQTPFQRLMAAIHTNLGPAGLNLPSSASFSNNWEPFTNRFGCTLTLGVPGHIQKYQEECIYTYAEEAQNKVCAKALELNAIGFMEWLKETLQPPILQNATNSPTGMKQVVVRPPQTTESLSLGTGEIDGKKELKAHCTSTGKNVPQYYEKMMLWEGEYSVVCGVSIGDQNFSVAKGDRSTEEIEVYLARRVLEDYFSLKT
ncbi:uncharacterized protein I206_103327 [Kwoniella pini CBS 10737]|uniref:Uncharacterized protein n=1 Tax=Kwoniella pini CBS 10737 TaxID=1296096 RepID=A0A1B9I9S9_9TREE|nr:uncharacterized protein I206_01667 [Kwoniella pini CBS 10737]OCF52378.1 hypothetical protein I206_01667 [Kwoniella pini CBS 10737]